MRTENENPATDCNRCGARNDLVGTSIVPKDIATYHEIQASKIARECRVGLAHARVVALHCYGGRAA